MKKLVFYTILFFITLSFLLANKNQPIQKNVSIDKIVVTKSKHIMELFCKNELIKTYKIAIGRGGLGAKEYEGDKKTP